jgi:hypothetical protein
VKNSIQKKEIEHYEYLKQLEIESDRQRIIEKEKIKTELAPKQREELHIQSIRTDLELQALKLAEINKQNREIEREKAKEINRINRKYRKVEEQIALSEKLVNDVYRYNLKKMREAEERQYLKDMGRAFEWLANQTIKIRKQYRRAISRRSTLTRHAVKRQQQNSIEKNKQKELEHRRLRNELETAVDKVEIKKIKDQRSL